MPTPSKKLKAIFVLVGVLFGIGLAIHLLYTAVEKVQENAALSMTQGKMKQMGLAMHMTQDVPENWVLPFAANQRQIAKGLSFRVTLLPNIEQDSLHKKIDLTQSWDSERNRPYTSVHIRSYADPLHHETMTGDQTPYRVFVGPGTLFAGDGRAIRTQEIPDGASNTILFVQAGETVPWAKPQELPYGPDVPLPKLGAPGRRTFPVCLADGSIRMIRTDIPEANLRRLIEAADGPTGANGSN
ncbi:MAG: DUF1559 domain-containing protein [Fimbriiglobus sp.]